MFCLTLHSMGLKNISYLVLGLTPKYVKLNSSILNSLGSVENEIILKTQKLKLAKLYKLKIKLYINILKVINFFI